jgi:SAM-dependent methyltransferase/uncharacterized protein YbaR (Trm112 family)
MKHRHFEAFQPICSVCRRDRQRESPLEIASVTRERSDAILEGILHCSDAACRREYPILDGIPYLIPSLRDFVGQNPLALLSRTDLSPAMDSLLGDCLGPGSAYDVARQHVGTYAWDHYGDLDPEAPDAFVGCEADRPQPGSLRRVLEVGLDLLSDGSDADRIVDLGCSVGRGTFDLAARGEALVLGLDLHVPMLRVASRVLHEGVVAYPLRRIGLVYDHRRFAALLPGRDRVDFWCADATAIPLPEGIAGLVTSLNVLDCTASPRDHLASLGAILAPGGQALLASPFDWSSQATRFPGWIGGHSQRGAAKGSPLEVLRSLLAEDPELQKLKLSAERLGLRWDVRLHDRQTVRYQTFLAVLRAHETLDR